MSVKTIEGNSVAINEFVGRIEKIDTTQSGLLEVHRGVVWESDDVFLRRLAESTQFTVISSIHDGIVSTVKDQPDTTGLDRSHQSTNFGWHKDGLAKKQLPEICMLYCVDSGNRPDVITVFTDT